MNPDTELRSARPKIYHARTSLICLALAYRSFITLIAMLGAGGYGYLAWSEAHAKNQLAPWLTIAVCGVVTMWFGWAMFRWVPKVLANTGKTLTLDADGIAFGTHSQTARYRWDEIRRVERDDRLNEQSNRQGVAVGLMQHYMGWLSRSTLKIHTTDDGVIVITPFFEQYDEICGRVERTHQRQVAP